MFQRLPDAPQPRAGAGDAVALQIDGRACLARAGESVAAALVGAGISACRTTPVGNQPRGPYCMMGVCFDCLVVIDGRPNQQACMVPVREGMRVERQHGARTAGLAT
jgi:predicted molibdopterin-dependent oxidoreductase YjgC